MIYTNSSVSCTVLSSQQSKINKYHIFLFVIRFYERNWVNQFKYDRPFHKGKKDKNSEFAVSFLICHKGLMCNVE